MNYDALTMAAVADELRERVLGGWVQKVVLPADLSLGLGIYAQHQVHWLLLSAHPQEARVQLVSEKLARASDQVSPLLLLARKRIRGQKLSAVEQVPYERVLTLAIGDCQLIVEAMGRHSNVILVGADGLILDSMKRIAPPMSRERLVLPHHPYVPPPAQNKLVPTVLTADELSLAFSAANPTAPAWQVLVSAVAAVSPTLAREVVYRATGSAETLASAAKNLEAIVCNLKELFSSLHSRRWEPSVAMEGEIAVAYAPYELRHLSNVRRCHSINEALESYYAQSDRLSPVEQARARLREEIASARQPRLRRLEALEHQLAQGEQAEELRWRGEMLLAFGPSFTKGKSELEVEGKRIPVDPNRSWLENAQSYFLQYSHARRALEQVPDLLAKTEQEIAYLEQVETYVSMADSVEELRRLKQEMDQALTGPASRTAKPAVPQKGKANASVGTGASRTGGGSRSAGLSPYAVSSDGFEIYVGRSGLQNELLTFHMAGPDDVWLHARGVPGAHVVVRARLETISADTLLEAARLAARFSRAGGSGKVEVDYTARKHVRKIKGAPPGMVSYTHEQSLLVEPAGEVQA